MVEPMPNRVGQYINTTGSGAELVLGDVLPGYSRALSSMFLADGESAHFTIVDGSNYQIVTGVWNATTGTITRTTIHEGWVGGAPQTSTHMALEAAYIIAGDSNQSLDEYLASKTVSVGGLTANNLLRLNRADAAGSGFALGRQILFSVNDESNDLVEIARLEPFRGSGVAGVVTGGLDIDLTVAGAVAQRIARFQSDAIIASVPINLGANALLADTRESVSGFVQEVDPVTFLADPTIHNTSPYLYFRPLADGEWAGHVFQKADGTPYASITGVANAETVDVRLDNVVKANFNTNGFGIYALGSGDLGSIYSSQTNINGRFVSWNIDGGQNENATRSQLTFMHGGATQAQIYTTWLSAEGRTDSLDIRTYHTDAPIYLLPNSTTTVSFGDDITRMFVPLSVDIEESLTGFWEKRDPGTFTGNVTFSGFLTMEDGVPTGNTLRLQRDRIEAYDSSSAAWQNLLAYGGGGNAVVLGSGADIEIVSVQKSLGIPEGITAPAAVFGTAQIFIDAADGNPKIRFSDGTLKTLLTSPA